ncbi:MAG: hypothetical protein ICV78_18235 [Tolypothrix sp. Co-bin9]|nr:hypothetical protein [Tolypothrix sp. Co-bin9]
MQTSQFQQSLPDILFQDAAHYLITNAVGKDEPPILYFLDGQYIFRYCENGRFHYKLLSSSTVASAFRHESIDSGWIFNNIVRHGISPSGKWWVKFTPATTYNLQIELNSDIQNITVPLPSLIFFCINKRYFVWAVKENSFIKEAILYHAPLPNVDDQGEICFGANLLTGDLEKDLSLFLQSPFTNHNVDAKSKKHNDDIRKILFTLATSKRRKYPINDLLPCERTVSIDWKINSLLKRFS